MPEALATNHKNGDHATAARPGSRARIGMAIATLLYAAVLAIIGGLLTLGGGWLVILGGSIYYLLAGCLTLICAALVALRRPGAGMVYAILMLGTIAWAIGEAGGDGWALVPRIVSPAVLGLPLLLAGLRSAVRPRAFAVTAACVGTAVLVGLVAHSLVRTPADPAFQAGVGAADVAGRVTGRTADGDWPHYGGDAGASRSSSLDQITPGNVARLQPVWSYRVGPTPAGRGAQSALEVTPIKIGDTLYLCTGYSDVIALDAETGRERWRFRSGADIRNVPVAACRGVAYARTGEAECPERILTNTVNADLIALDARTGRKCRNFGVDGSVSLLGDMGVVRPGYYYQTSAPTLVGGNIVVGGWVFDNQFWGEPSGVIRAYDVRTGKLAWAWDMGHPERTGSPPPGERFTPSTPNSWAPMAADEALGMVYVPLGSPPPDHFGGQRRAFDEQFATSIVALDARTGRVRWSFQTVHHDLWDYDLASPSLTDVRVGDAIVPALLQPTKRGQLFLLDRRTGKPLSRVVEQRVPTGGTVPGERLAGTQPYSVGLPALSGPALTERDMWGVTALDQLWCRITFRQTRFEGEFTPPGLKPFLIYPGYMGGSNWGGVSIDSRRGVAIVNTLRLATRAHLIPDAERRERGIVPLDWSRLGQPGTGHPSMSAQGGTPVGVQLTPFLSPLNIPCQQPPYGTISAVNLRTRKLIWTKPLGTARESGPMGIRSGLPLPIGTPMQGGALTTASGLTFIGATQDAYFRALETASGRQLWEAKLPAGGHASPATFMTASGRQLVVIAAGGSMPLRSRIGDYIIAYGLPRGREGTGSEQ